jgi:hypothetical protein
MKAVSSKSFFFSALLLSLAALPSCSADDKPSSLHVLLAVTLGTRTHSVALLETGRELLKRKHKVFYAANDDQISWASSIPNIQTINYGKNFLTRPDVAARAKKMIYMSDNVDKSEVPGDSLPMMYHDYDKEYPILCDIISGKRTDNKPMDVVACDFMAAACLDAAYDLDVPYVIFGMSYEYEGGSLVTLDSPVLIHRIMDRLR